MLSSLRLSSITSLPRSSLITLPSPSSASRSSCSSGTSGSTTAWEWVDWGQGHFLLCLVGYSDNVAYRNLIQSKQTGRVVDVATCCGFSNDLIKVKPSPWWIADSRNAGTMIRSTCRMLLAKTKKISSPQQPSLHIFFFQSAGEPIAGSNDQVNLPVLR